MAAIMQRVEQFLKTGFGRSVMAEAEKVERVAELRARIGKELGALRAKQDKTVGALVEKIKTLRGQGQVMQRAHEAALAEKGVAIGAAEGELRAMECHRDALEGELRRSCSPLIDAFVNKRLNDEEETRRLFRSYSTETRNKNQGFIEIETLWFSNKAAIVTRREAIKAAREAADLLRLEPIDEDALAVRLAEIEATIPPLASVEVMAAVA